MSENIEIPFIVLSALSSKAESLINDITIFDLAAKCLPDDEEDSLEYVYNKVNEFFHTLGPKAKLEVATAMMLEALMSMTENLADELSTDETVGDGPHTLGNA